MAVDKVKQIKTWIPAPTRNNPTTVVSGVAYVSVEPALGIVAMTLHSTKLLDIQWMGSVGLQQG